MSCYEDLLSPFKSYLSIRHDGVCMYLYTCYVYLYIYTQAQIYMYICSYIHICIYIFFIYIFKISLFHFMGSSPTFQIEVPVLQRNALSYGDDLSWKRIDY